VVEDRTLVARQGVVATWVAGRALSRGVTPPTSAYGGLRVDVGLPDQRARYVFADASDGVRQASAELMEPHVFLKICAPPAAVAPLLAPGWYLKPPSVMMMADDLGGSSAQAPDGYALSVERVGPVFVATCSTADGRPVASGRIAFAGGTAVFDRIETHLEHRRRGLGRAVMSALAARARGNGAEVGVLVATPDGQALYGAMGWRVLSPHTTALGD
jgi:GNAT superfamily N-acetyltransferase